MNERQLLIDLIDEHSKPSEHHEKGVAVSNPREVASAIDIKTRLR